MAVSRSIEQQDTYTPSSRESSSSSKSLSACAMRLCAGEKLSMSAFSSATLEIRSLTAHSLTGHRMHGAAVNTEQDALLDEYDDEKPSPKRLVVCLDVATLFTTARQHSDRFMYILTVFAALGGFLFGYDTGVVSGAMLLISDEFTLSDVQQVSFVTRTTTNIDIIPHRS